MVGIFFIFIFCEEGKFNAVKQKNGKNLLALMILFLMSMLCAVFGQ